MTTKFLFIADIHANKERYKSVIKLLQQCKQIITDKKIDYFLIGGDFWDCVISNTKNSGFTDIVKELNNICKETEVIAIMGTPFHEPEGSMDFLEALGGTVVKSPTLLTLKNNIKLLCIPEPRRSNFIRNSVQETTSAMIKSLNDACDNEADIIIYHGEISGAKMDNGVYAKSDVQLTKSMIERTKAQLTLCGHLHTPQEPFNNCIYVGSPIPKNAGETHEGSFITFTVNDNNVCNVQRVKTNFPTYRTIECNKLEFDRLFNLNFTNVNLKIKLSLTPAEKKFFHSKDKEKQLKEKTNAYSVKIAVLLDKEISVRSKEIVKTNSMQDKLEIYAKVNNLSLSKEMIAKAKDIEDSMLIKYISPSHSFELLSISLRGCKCIKGKEEVNIDFSKCLDGVVLLIGENGSGKSSLAENCLPFPCMLTRSGSLRSFFYLKDSHRIVVFRDENNLYYKFTIQLAAHIDNGLIKYFVETSEDEGQTWKSVIGVDGSLDSYKKYVEEQFGSLELYLRTAFFTTEKTKGVSDIASATKSERITLLSELLNFNSVATMHELVKEKMKVLEKDLLKYDNLEASKLQCEKDLSEKKENENILSEKIKDVSIQKDNLEKQIEETRKKANEFAQKYGQFKSAITLKQNCEEQYNKLLSHLDELKIHKIQNDFYKFHKEQIAEFKTCYEESKPILNQLNELSKKRQEISDELFEQTNNLNSITSCYEDEKRKFENIDTRIKDAEQGLLPISETCPTCGAKLSEKKKKELFKSNDYIKSQIDSLKQFKINQKEIVNSSKKELTNISNKVKRIKEKKTEIDEQYSKLNDNYEATRLYLERNSQYEEYISYIEVSNLENDILRTEENLQHEKSMLETLDGVDNIDYEQDLLNLENKRKNIENENVSLSMDLASVQTQIKQLTETLSVIKEQELEKEKIFSEYKDFSFLEKAFSNTGIQALELEAVAPDIADITNNILHESYGDKFSISFKTIKESKNKLIDDFSIDVTNHDTGWTIPIEQLSKGEKVWITQALYYAFSLIRMQKTNFSFKVRFVDESDGGLDSEHRLQYLKMIESAHKAGNARLTVMITHSQEIKDIVQQTIQL